MATSTNTVGIAGDPVKSGNQLKKNNSYDWYTPFGRVGDQAGMDYWDKEIASKGEEVAHRAFLTAAVQNMVSGKGVGADSISGQGAGNQSADWYTPFGRVGDQAGIDYWNNEIRNKGYDTAHNAFQIAAAQNLANGKAVGAGDIAGQLPVDAGTGQARSNPNSASGASGAKNEPVYNTNSLARSSNFESGGNGDYLSQLKNKYGRYVMGDANPFLNLNSSAAFISGLMNGAGAGANFSDAQKAEVRYDYLKASQDAGIQGKVNDQDAQWLKLAGQNGYGYTQDSVLDTANRNVFGGKGNQADLDVLNYFQQGPDAWKKGSGTFEAQASKYGASPQMQTFANEMGYTPLQSSGMYSGDPYQDMQKRIESYGSLNSAQQAYLQQQLQGLSTGQRQQMQQFFPWQQAAPQPQQPQPQNPYLQPFQQTAAYNQAVNTNWASPSQPKAGQYWGTNNAQSTASSNQNGNQNFPNGQPNWNRFQPTAQADGSAAPVWGRQYQTPFMSWGAANQVAPYGGGFENSFQQPRGLLNQGQGFGQQQPANNTQNRYGLLSAYGSR
ncbi:hypothetical protein [Undibacterium sp. TS12]|uniref:hypothetical protein n=1 Tax=Undibacterium sp. TS12 TaxID=2908202 RepID=UPI001F4C7B4F|nr:hypothetical protein [Undibacterium sp. TS12]MCH8622637.1 hypothetical protein [Undibacterium sp. TS12]